MPQVSGEWLVHGGLPGSGTITCRFRRYMVSRRAQLQEREWTQTLTKRNMAAHPSVVAITVYQAQDAISDLVNNVILKLI